MSLPFTGEMMTCVVCGHEQRSNPDVESNWRRLDVDNNCFYVCPDEFPPEGAPSTKFKKAYQIAIACCVNELTKRAGGRVIDDIEEYRRKRSLYVIRKKSLKSKGFG